MKIELSDKLVHRAHVSIDNMEITVSMNPECNPISCGNIMVSYRSKDNGIAWINFPVSSMAEAHEYGKIFSRVGEIIMNFHADIMEQKKSFAMRESTKIAEIGNPEDLGFIGEDHGI